MERLCKSLVAAFVFLELSGDGVVDPDAAVGASEAMAAELQSASQEEKAAFIRACAQEAAASGDARVVQFIAELPRQIGIAGDEA